MGVHMDFINKVSVLILLLMINAFAFSIQTVHDFPNVFIPGNSYSGQFSFVSDIRTPYNLSFNYFDSPSDLNIGDVDLVATIPCNQENATTWKCYGNATNGRNYFTIDITPNVLLKTGNYSWDLNITMLQETGMTTHHVSGGSGNGGGSYNYPPSNVSPPQSPPNNPSSSLPVELQPPSHFPIRGVTPIDPVITGIGAPRQPPSDYIEYIPTPNRGSSDLISNIINSCLDFVRGLGLFLVNILRWRPWAV